MFTATGLKRSELGSHGRKLVRQDGKQVLVIAREGRLFAIANRCPHEGYPLSEGTIGPECVLTCNWHNWKFELASGAALVGRDPVRTYPVAERGGEIFIDFRDPPANQRRARALRGIEAAILDNDRARMAREAALAHYAAFGHCAIYTLKAGQLIEGLGEQVAEPVLLALTRMRSPEPCRHRTAAPSPGRTDPEA